MFCSSMLFKKQLLKCLFHFIKVCISDYLEITHVPQLAVPVTVVSPLGTPYNRFTVPYGKPANRIMLITITNKMYFTL